IYMDILKGKLTSKNYQSYFPDITGITVCSNTKDLIERAYTSVRKFHTYMPIIIVDGSDPKNPCATYVKSLASNLTTVISLGYNIGHGKGMAMGINQAKTKYALIFDSDIEMLKSPVNQMLEMMEEDTFGVGFIQKVGMDGYDYGVKPEHKKQKWMPYLHPYFQLINIKNYRKFHPYVHHGAPCYLTMRDIYKRGLSNKILKEFPGLGHSASQGFNWKGKSREYIRHDTRGTRNERKQKNLNEIDQGWVYK
ncbi:MAG: glycosyltransferase family 2 protein, partial [Promethearchaeota archaeon]